MCPNPVETAIIPPEKIRDYLLSPIHPIGRYKAAFFRAQGYEQGSWYVLENDTRSLLTTEARPLDTNAFGTKYRVDGDIASPSGRVFGIRTVWIIIGVETVYRFVTAYPGHWQ